jgi:3-deoxy-D-manno-octulosonic-acid transferase
MSVLQSFFMALLVGIMKISAIFHPKARLWVQGRVDWRNQYAQKFKKTTKVFWMHVSSLGEFEQGRPIFEAFKKEHPDWQMVLTFFSPSGFEIRKNYAQADFVAYLPADTAQNAKDFIDIIQPDLVVWVKYDFWYNFLTTLKNKNIPCYLVAAKFRREQPFFRWYGHYWRQMLASFSHIFVQDDTSVFLLEKIGINEVTEAGDPRIDRVFSLAKTASPNAVVENFCAINSSNRPSILVVGSSWPADEEVYLPILQKPDFQYLRAIVAPHEPSEIYSQNFSKKYPNVWKYSKKNEETTHGRLPIVIEEKDKNPILLIDNIGLLNTLYRYGTIAYIGGGFGTGIHNILEPAAYGLPIIFGPNYQKFGEANQLIALGGAFSIQNQTELELILQKLRKMDFYLDASETCSRWLQVNKGASDLILNHLNADINA